MTTLTSDQKNELNEILNKKIALENKLQPKIKAVFSKIVKEYGFLLKGEGLTVDAQKFQPEIEKILFDHYQEVSKKFGSDEEEDKILIPFLQNRASKQAAIITKTNQKEIRESSVLAIKALIEDKKEINNRNISVVGQKILRKKFKSRSNSIKVTETQNPAEATRMTVAEVQADVSPTLSTVLPSIKKIDKSWQTIIDGLERAWHHEANAQKVNSNQPFVVKGQFLMFPGDTTLGATADNIIGCRCSVLYNS